MEIKKEKNEFERCYDFEFVEGNKKLDIFYGGNLDLYFSISDNDLIPENIDSILSFDITKENYEVYSLFDSLYKNIIKCNLYGKCNEDVIIDKKLYKNSFQYKSLVDKDKNITWVSDDDPYDIGDRLIIMKNDNDSYKLLFERNHLINNQEMKSGIYISVRIRNSGSRYDPFNCCFMNLYNELQNINTECHQIHMEEIFYQNKLLKKTR